MISIFVKNLVNTFKLSNNITRNYAFKSDLKIKWVRPEKIPCYDPRKTGDLVPFPELNNNDIITNFRNSKELETADATVRKLFEIKHNPRKEAVRIVVENLTKNVQRHGLDYGSMESKLASMTANIRSMQQIMLEFPRNKILKVKLKELIDKRKKYLKFLRRYDYKRFEWLIEKLDIVYKSPPSSFHWITRKDSLRKLTDIHCENIKNERLNEYRKRLEIQKIEFLENKIKKLEFIQSSQKEFKLPITITNDDIDAAKKQLSDLQK